MAQKRCPGCGTWYSGRKCPECYYIPFDAEEIRPYGLRKNAPVPQPRSRKYYSRQKKVNRSKAFSIFITVLTLITMLLPLIGNVSSLGAGIAPEPRPEIQLPEHGTVLFETEDLKVLADWQNGDPITGSIRLVVQNDSLQNLTVQSSAVAVNGIMVDNVFFYCDAPEKSVCEGTLWISLEELSARNIGPVESIRGTLDIFDSDSYQTVFWNHPFSLYTGEGRDSVPALDSSGQILLENETMMLTYQGWEIDEYNDLRLRFYVENRSNQMLYLSSSDIYLDGELTDLHFWSCLIPNSCSLCFVELYSWETEDTDIFRNADIMTFSLQSSNSQGWDYIQESDVLTVVLNP